MSEERDYYNSVLILDCIEHVLCGKGKLLRWELKITVRSCEVKKRVYARIRPVASSPELH